MKVDIHDPLASLVIPDNLEQQEIMGVQMYQVGLHKDTKDVTKFTDGMTGDICHKPHTFENALFLMIFHILRSILFLIAFE